MSKEIKFSQVKNGQLFTHGEGMGMTTYKKKDKTGANPAHGQEHHFYGFKPNQVVKVEAWQTKIIC